MRGVCAIPIAVSGCVPLLVCIYQYSTSTWACGRAHELIGALLLVRRVYVRVRMSKVSACGAVSGVCAIRTCESGGGCLQPEGHLYALRYAEHVEYSVNNRAEVVSDPALSLSAIVFANYEHTAASAWA